MKRLLLNSLSLYAGFILSAIGVLLPWHARNAYLHVLGVGSDKVLRSKAILDFLIGIAFSSKEESEVLRVSSRIKNHG